MCSRPNEYNEDIATGHFPRRKGELVDHNGSIRPDKDPWASIKNVRRNPNPWPTPDEHSDDITTRHSARGSKDLVVETGSLDSADVQG